MSSTRDNFIEDVEVLGQGARKSLHGSHFQLKMLMHVLWMAQKSGYEKFRLATELPDAEKLDDVVFQYFNDGSWKLRLFQIKHRDDPKYKEDARTIFSKNMKKDFAIIKYFKSLVSIEERCKMKTIYSVFREAEVEDACIITNTDFTSDDQHKQLIQRFCRIENRLEEDKLLAVNSDHSVITYTITAGSDLAQEFISIFEPKADIYKHVDDLAQDILFKKKVDQSANFLKEFWYPLKKEVFASENVKDKYLLKFSKSFLEGTCLKEETKPFRLALFKQIIILKSTPKPTSGSQQENPSKSCENTEQSGKVPSNFSSIVNELVDLIHTSSTSRPLTKQYTECWDFASKYIYDFKSGTLHSGFVEGNGIDAVLRDELFGKIVKVILDKVELSISEAMHLKFTEDYVILKDPKKFAKELFSKFNSISVFHKRIGDLAWDIVFEKAASKSENFLKEFKRSLRTEVFVPESIDNEFHLKFSTGFLDGKDLAESTKVFRSVLMKHILFLRIQKKRAEKYKRKMSMPPKQPGKIPVGFTSIISELVDVINKLSSIKKESEAKYKECWDFAKKYIYDFEFDMLHDGFIRGDDFPAMFRSKLIDRIISNDAVTDSKVILKNILLPISEKLYSGFCAVEFLELNESGNFANELCSKFKCISITPPRIENINNEWRDFEQNLRALSQRHVIIEVFSKCRFSSSFIEGKSLGADLEEFRNELLSKLRENPDLEVNESFDLINYFFEIDIKDFGCLNEEFLLKSLPKPFEQKDFDNFFKKFKLIVNYPSRFEISALLEESMRKQFKNLDSEAFCSLFEVKMLNWICERFGTFYTAEKVTQLFAVLMKSLICWQIDGINKSYFALVPERYVFKTLENQVLLILRKFLCDTEEEVLYLAFEYLILGRIRVYQAFQKLIAENNPVYQGYTNMFGHIFLFAKKLEDSKFRQLVRKALQENDLWNVVFIDCNVDDCFRVITWIEDMQDLNSRLNIKRKFILLTSNRSKEVITGQDFKTFTTNCTDLEDESLTTVLMKECLSVQGSSVLIENLLTAEWLKFINAEILVKFIEEENVEIGREICFSKGYDPSFYLHRDLEGLNDDMIDKPYHFILSGEAGMGKSTFLSNFSNEIRKINPGIWVIRIDLNKYFSFFNTMINNKLDYSAIDFLVELLKSNEKSKLKTDFEVKLLKAALGTLKDLAEGGIKSENDVDLVKLRVALFFDGFDEISPSYKDVCIKFLKEIKKCRLASLIVTTRPYFEEDLKKLGIGPIAKLSGIEYKKKIEYVKKLLCKEMLGEESYFSWTSDIYLSDRENIIILTCPYKMDMSKTWQYIQANTADHRIRFIDSKLCELVYGKPDPTNRRQTRKSRRRKPHHPRSSSKEFNEKPIHGWKGSNQVHSGDKILNQMVMMSSDKSKFVDVKHLIFGNLDVIAPRYQDIVIDIIRNLRNKYKITVLTNSLVDKAWNCNFLRTYMPTEVDFGRKFHCEGLEYPVNPLGFDFRLHNAVISLIGPDPWVDDFYTTPLYLELISKRFMKLKEDSQAKSYVDFIMSPNISSDYLKPIDLLDLYTDFIERMHSVYWFDKMQQNQHNPAANLEKINSFESYIKRHQKLAIYTLFYSREKCLKILLSHFGNYEKVLGDIKEHLKQIESGEEKGGLVNGIYDGRPDFIHRSFAEYFVADFKGDVLSLNGASRDFFKLCVNCSHVDPDMVSADDVLNREICEQHAVFSPEVCKFFQISLKKKALKIAKAVVQHSEYLSNESSSEKAQWITEKKTLLTIFSSYPELFKHIYELLKSKLSNITEEEMLWDFIVHYFNHIYDSSLDSESDIVQQKHSFYLDNFKLSVFSSNDGANEHFFFGSEEFFKTKNLSECFKVVNLGVDIDWDSDLFKSDFASSIERVMESDLIDVLREMRRMIAIGAFELIRKSNSTKNFRELNMKAYHAAFYAWPLEFMSEIWKISPKTPLEFKGTTLLHIASYRGYRDLLKWLLLQGYPINLSDDRGTTPLDYLDSDSIDWLVKEQVLDSRYQTDFKFVSELKKNPQECPRELMPEKDVWPSKETFDIVLGAGDDFFSRLPRSYRYEIDIFDAFWDCAELMTQRQLATICPDK